MGIPDWINDDLCRRALQLIATAHEDEQVVLDILYEAFSHLDASTLTAEKTLLDRIKHSRQKSGLVLLGPPLLERLIFKFSDLYAMKDNELDQPETTMLARYLQALLLYCLHRSSRWMVVGMGQLVFSYSGPQVAEITGRIILRDWDNSDRSRAKRKMMAYLQSRFNMLVPADTQPLEDKHFAPAPDQDNLARLLQRYLELYIPWGTAHLLLSPNDLDRVAADHFTEKLQTSLMGDVVELDRFHVLIDLNCFATLTNALGYPHWTERLRVPNLICSNCNNTSSSDRHPSSLDRNRLEVVLNRLQSDALRRSTVSFLNVGIFVDGSYVGSLSKESDTAEFTRP